MSLVTVEPAEKEVVYAAMSVAKAGTRGSDETPIAGVAAAMHAGAQGALPRGQRRRRSLKSRNAHEEHTDLLLQRLVLREQFENQQLQAVLVERIECFRRHPELESATRNAFNAESPSQTDAEG
jgi:hypothetical protein